MDGTGQSLFSTTAGQIINAPEDLATPLGPNFVKWLKLLQDIAQTLKTDRKILFPAAFALAAGLAATIMFFGAIHATDWVSHTYEVRLTAKTLTKHVEEADASAEGYLLTRREQFLEPYRRAASGCRPELESLHKLLRDNPAQQARIAELGRLVEAKLESLDKAIELNRQERQAEGISNIALDQGLMDQIHTLMNQFSSEEQNLLAMRVRQEDGLRVILFALIIAAMLSAASLAIAAFRSQRVFIEKLQNEISRRERTESTLRQSQKMEAVGQLTGGVAHDFNNILTIILGNLDTIRRRLSNMDADMSATLARPLDAAIQASKNAAKLTHRLLAFSRLQPLEPVPLDLNKAVAGMSDLLSRTVGSPIALETVLAGGLWLAFADANQLENTLINLVVNAKDAMPEGGKITIETANAYLDEAYARRFGDIKAGQYVVLSVTDTGTGIAPEVIDRVFEPFFTTKQPGMGTGLGLSMIHGFVKQSGGHIRIYSEAGHGTTVRIYLPRLVKLAQEAAPKGQDAAPKTPPRSKGSETIMVVEDNGGVLDFACTTLEDLGYRVLTASSGPAALNLLESGENADLLFTDVVLTEGMNGRQLADIVTASRPGLPVLFTTGYSRNAIVHNGKLDEGVNFLGKPYTQQELAEKVRAVLDGSNV